MCLATIFYQPFPLGGLTLNAAPKMITFDPQYIASRRRLIVENRLVSLLHDGVKMRHEFLMPGDSSCHVSPRGTIYRRNPIQTIHFLHPLKWPLVAMLSDPQRRAI